MPYRTERVGMTCLHSCQYPYLLEEPSKHWGYNINNKIQIKKNHSFVRYLLDQKWRWRSKEKLNKNKQELTLFWALESGFQYLCPKVTPFKTVQIPQVSFPCFKFWIFLWVFFCQYFHNSFFHMHSSKSFIFKKTH